MTLLNNDVAAKTPGPPALLARLRAELQTNRRAALGIAAIGVILAVYALLRVADGVDTRRQHYVKARHYLERLDAAKRDKAWPQRAAASAVLRQALEARLWRGDTDGIVQADLQDWVTDQARKAGLERVQVALEDSRLKDPAANFHQITATITALDTEPTVIAFLDRIAHEPHLLVVDQLKVEEAPVHSMQMKLIAYAIVKADGQPAR